MLVKRWEQDEKQQLGYWSPDLDFFPHWDDTVPGDADCLCSQCQNPIWTWEDLIVVWHGGAQAVELRLHTQCFLHLTSEGKQSRGFIFQDMQQIFDHYWRVRADV